MRDIGEGAAVYQGRIAFQGLHQVGFAGVFEQCGHRAVHVEIFGAHGLAGAGLSDNYFAEPFFELT